MVNRMTAPGREDSRAVLILFTILSILSPFILSEPSPSRRTESSFRVALHPGAPGRPSARHPRAPVIPANAGIQTRAPPWIPAFAGMTEGRRG